MKMEYQSGHLGGVLIHFNTHKWPVYLSSHVQYLENKSKKTGWLELTLLRGSHEIIAQET